MRWILLGPKGKNFNSNGRLQKIKLTWKITDNLIIHLHTCLTYITLAGAYAHTL